VNITRDINERNTNITHGIIPIVLDNQITTIEGLKNCQRLQHLSLAHNHICHIEQLEGLPLKYLNLVR
jgi:hypothetical protein